MSYDGGFLYAKFSGLGRGNQVFWAKIETLPVEGFDCKLSYEGGVSIRKIGSIGNILVMAMNGVGQLSETDVTGTEVHTGEFKGAVKDGLGILSQKNKLVLRGKWCSGEVKIVQQDYFTPEQTYKVMTIRENSTYYTKDRRSSTRMQDACFHNRCTDFLSYKINDSRSISDGVYEIVNKDCITSANVYRMSWHRTLESDYFDVKCLVWKGDSYDDDMDIIKICNNEDVSIVSFLSKDCPSHGELTPMSTTCLRTEMSEIFSDDVFGNNKHDWKHGCNCVENEEVVFKSLEIEKVVFEDTVVEKSRKIKRSDAVSDTYSCTDSDDKKLPGIRGVSKRDMSSSESYESSGKLEEDLVDNKWTLIRNKKHLVYSRIIVKDGKEVNQRFVCASTPSDSRSETICINTLKNLNRGVTEARLNK